MVLETSLNAPRRLLWAPDWNAPSYAMITADVCSAISDSLDLSPGVNRHAVPLRTRIEPNGTPLRSLKGRTAIASHSLYSTPGYLANRLSFWADRPRKIGFPVRSTSPDRPTPLPRRRRLARAGTMVLLLRSKASPASRKRMSHESASQIR